MAKPKRRLGIFTDRELTVMAIPLLCVASLHISRKPLWALLHLTGQDNGCSYERALDSELQALRQNAINEQLLTSSQVEVEKSSGLTKWTTEWGVFWAPADTRVPFLIGEQKMRDYGDGPRRVQPGDVVIDCGANIGTFTKEALDAGASKVVAVEPSERNIECLRRNFPKEIADGRVVVYPKGVWHRDEVLEFNVYENSALDSFVMNERMEEDKAPKKVKVPVTTLDKIVEELKLEKVSYIKMDVEGAERHALRGAVKTIKKMRPRLSIATENLDDDPKVVPQVVAEMGMDYKRECGPCDVMTLIRLRPGILYFY